MKAALLFSIALATACGGRVSIDYSDPDADLGLASEGGAADAAPLGHAGTACIAYDGAALFATGPTCAQNSDCDSWDAAAPPPGLTAAFLYYKVCSPSQSCRQTFPVYKHPGSILPCSGENATGDAYCMAYAQQYVTHGKTVARCVPNSDSDGHIDNTRHFCAFACSGPRAWCGSDDQHLFCITSPSGAQCTTPCTGTEDDVPAP